MQDENGTTPNRLEVIRTEIEQEDNKAIWQTKIGIGIRIFLVVFIIGYMSWIKSSVARMDAAELTRVAATSIEDRIPEFRADLRDYALEMAPELTDTVRNLMVQLPARVRETIEGTLSAQTDRLIAQFEHDLDEALGGVVDKQMKLLQTEFGGSSPEEQLDALIVGVSDIFRETMLAALDELYVGYSQEVRKLSLQLVHLQKDANLTESEKIDKQLIEAWMVLVHRHDITQPKNVIGELAAARF